MVKNDIGLGGASRQCTFFEKCAQKACSCPQCLDKALDRY